MTWYYDGVPFQESGTHFGFVYLIENLITGRKYIGRKYFSKAGTKQVPYRDWETDRKSVV